MDYDLEFKSSLKESYSPSMKELRSSKKFQINEFDSLGEFGFPMKFSDELAREIQVDIQMNLSNSPIWNYVPKRSWKTEIRSEVYRFYLALRTYLEFKGSLITAKELIDGILDFNYIVWLKKARSYMAVNTGSGFFLEEDPDMEKIKDWAKDKNLIDLGDMFNPRYWLNWELPDDEDWRYFWVPCPKVDQRHIDELYKVVTDLLPEEVDYVQEEEILLETTGSSALDEKTWKTKPHWYQKGEGKNYFSSQPLLGKGTFIQTYASETRYACTFSVPHTNSVKLIEKQIALVAEEIPYSIYVKDPVEYEKRYDQFNENYSHFLCRDLKKDGITKVRELVQTVLKAVKDKYPNMPASKYFSIYDSFAYLGPSPDDPEGNDVRFPPRGVGLGMSSAITTILQSALFMITLNRLHEEESVNGSIGALFYHDDAAIGCEDLNDLEEYNRVEDQVMLDYRQIKNKKKSFYAEWFVICERYNCSYDDKKSYEATILRMVHASVNIAHAKNQWALNLRYIHSVDWRSYLTELVTHFGYEFYPDEVKYPLTHGGWIPAKYMSVDISWHYTEEHTQENMAASIAARRYPLYTKMNKKKYKGSYYSPYEQLYPRCDFGPHQKSFLVGMQKFEVADHYIRLDKLGAKTGYWKHQFLERSQEYVKLRRRRRDIREYFDMYCEIHKESDIVPPKMLILTVEEDFEEVERKYFPANPKLAYLKYLNPDKISNGILPYPVPPGMRLDSPLRLTAQERRQLTYTLDLLEYNNIGEIPLLRLKPRFYKNNETYFEPTNVASYMIATTGIDCLPIMKKKEHLLNVRKEWQPYAKLLYTRRGQLIEKIIQRIKPPEPKIFMETTFASELEDQVMRRLHAIELLKIGMQVLRDQEINNSIRSYNADSDGEEHESNIAWTDAPLEDDGFWNWTTSKKNYRNWRQRYFLEMEEKMLVIELQYMGFLKDVEYIDVDPEYCFNIVERHLWQRAGGTLVWFDGEAYPQWRCSALDQDSPEPSNAPTHSSLGSIELPRSESPDMVFFD
jgi:hypothetical protein